MNETRANEDNFVIGHSKTKFRVWTVGSILCNCVILFAGIYFVWPSISSGKFDVSLFEWAFLGFGLLAAFLFAYSFIRVYSRLREGFSLAEFSPDGLTGYSGYNRVSVPWSAVISSQTYWPTLAIQYKFYPEGRSKSGDHDSGFKVKNVIIPHFIADRSAADIKNALKQNNRL